MIREQPADIDIGATRYATKIEQLRATKRGKGGAFYTSVEEIFEDHGHFGLFDPVTVRRRKMIRNAGIGAVRE